MRKPVEDVTERVPIPRLRPGVIDDSIENQILLPPKKELDQLLRQEEDTRRIRKVQI